MLRHIRLAPLQTSNGGYQVAFDVARCVLLFSPRMFRFSEMYVVRLGVLIS